MTVVQGSSHFAGFIGQYVFSSADAGVTPAFNLDQGLPPYPLPPLIDPAFSNNNDVDWFNGQAASRPAVYDNWTISVQRELRRGLSVELDYNGVYGSDLQSGLLNPNQVPMSVVNDLVARFGPTGARDLLNSQITSAAAVAAGIRVPYPNFTNPNVQRSRTVAQALRPYPQYLAVNVQSGGGDKMGRSHYHAGVVKVNQRMTGGLSLQSSYTYSKLMTDADSFSGSGRAMDAAQPELEWSVGRFDQTHIIKINTVYELPFGEGRRWLQTGIANQIVGGWRVALIQSYSSGQPIAVTTNAPLNIFNGTNRPNVVAGADWRAPIAGGGVRPARRPVPEPRGVRAAGRPVGQRAARERGCAALLEPEREHEHRQIDQGHRKPRYGHPDRGLQPVQPRDLGNAQPGFQQQQLRPDQQSGQHAPADADRAEAVLVGPASAGRG